MRASTAAELAVTALVAAALVTPAAHPMDREARMRGGRSSRPIGRGLLRGGSVGATSALLAIALALILPGTSAAASVDTYRVASAKLSVMETASYKSASKVAWEGDGHRHETLAAADPELPSLPIAIPRAGGAVVAPTDVEIEGREKMTDYEGQLDPCSSSWDETETGALTVRVVPKRGGGTESIWELPHGIATNECGFGYDLIRVPSLTVKATTHAEIGDKRLVFRTKNKKNLSEAAAEGTVKQQIDWEGELTLVRMAGR